MINLRKNTTVYINLRKKKQRLWFKNSLAMGIYVGCGYGIVVMTICRYVVGRDGGG